MSTFNIFERNVQDPCSAACDFEDVSFSGDCKHGSNNNNTSKNETINNKINLSYTNQIAESNYSPTSRRYTSASPLVVFSNVFSDNEYDNDESDDASETPEFDDGIIKHNSKIKNGLKNEDNSNNYSGSLSSRNNSVNSNGYNKQDNNSNRYFPERPQLRTRANSSVLIHQIARSPIYLSNNNNNNNNNSTKNDNDKHSNNISASSTPSTSAFPTLINNNNNTNLDNHDDIPRFLKDRSMSFSSNSRNKSFIINPLLRSNFNVNFEINSNMDISNNSNTRNHFRRQSSSYAIPTHVYGLEKYVSSALDELSSKSNNSQPLNFKIKERDATSANANKSFESSDSTVVDTANNNNKDDDIDILQKSTNSSNSLSTTSSISSNDSFVCLSDKDNRNNNNSNNLKSTNKRKVNKTIFNNNSSDNNSLSKHSDTRRSFIKLSLSNSFAS